jgi:amidophosphoribosyltransferase
MHACTPCRLAPCKSGIIGIFKHEGPANVELYEGLLMLQHRGQDSAGMVTTDAGTGRFRERKDHGMVKDVFEQQEDMALLQGSMGIAIVSNFLPGTDLLDHHELQPQFVNSPLGIYLMHNGRLTNTEELRENLDLGSEAFVNRHLFGTTDAEVLINVMADEIHRAHTRCLYTSGCDVEKEKVGGGLRIWGLGREKGEGRGTAWDAKKKRLKEGEGKWGVYVMEI